jgi:hypothetical protein
MEQNFVDFIKKDKKNIATPAFLLYIRKNAQQRLKYKNVSTKNNLSNKEKSLKRRRRKNGKSTNWKCKG